MKIILDSEDRMLIRSIVNTNPKAKVLMNKVGNFLGIKINISEESNIVPPPLIIEVNKETMIKIIVKANSLANPSSMIGSLGKSVFRDIFKIHEDPTSLK